MDTSSIAIGLVLLLIFIGPIGYLVIIQKNKGKACLKTLQVASQRNQLSLSETEILPTVSLGLDTASRKLLVIQNQKNGKEVLIDLAQFRSSEVVDSNAAGHSADNYNPQEEVHILLKGTPGTADEKISFFHEDQDSMTAKEERLNSAKKWNAKLRDLIRK